MRAWFPDAGAVIVNVADPPTRAWLMGAAPSTARVTFPETGCPEDTGLSLRRWLHRQSLVDESSSCDLPQNCGAICFVDILCICLHRENSIGVVMSNSSSVSWGRTTRAGSDDRAVTISSMTNIDTTMWIDWIIAGDRYTGRKRTVLGWSKRHTDGAGSAGS